MAALSQANATGNYSVLYALSAPSFQQANSPEKLAQIFARLRASGDDITPVILYQPILQGPPKMSEKGIVHLAGYYATQPKNVVFEMLFIPAGGLWRLEGLAVSTRPAQQTAAASAPAPAPAADKAGGQQQDAGKK